MYEILLGYIIGTLFGMLVTFQWAFKRGVQVGVAAVIGVDEEEIIMTDEPDEE